MEKAPPGLTDSQWDDWHMKHDGSLGCGAWLFFITVAIVLVMVVESLLGVEIPWWQWLVLVLAGTLFIGFAF
jgi:hypothetical protein